MARVQGLVLIPSAQSETRLQTKVHDFLSRPLNNRRDISLHLTLLLYHLPDAVITQVIAKLDAIPFEVPQLASDITSLEKIGDKYIGFRLTNPAFAALHEQFVTYLAPTISGHFNPKYLDQQLTPHELDYLHNYGYHRIKEFFLPHLTIGGYDNATIRDAEFAFAPHIQDSITFDKLYFDNAWENADPATTLWSRNLN